MKLAVAAVVAIGLCLLSLSVRHAAYARAEAVAPPQAAGRAAPTPRAAAEKRALAAIDQRLHRKLRMLAASPAGKPVVASR